MRLNLKFQLLSLKYMVNFTRERSEKKSLEKENRPVQLSVTTRAGHRTSN